MIATKSWINAQNLSKWIKPKIKKSLVIPGLPIFPDFLEFDIFPEFFAEFGIFTDPDFLDFFSSELGIFPDLHILVEFEFFPNF